MRSGVRCDIIITMSKKIVMWIGAGVVLIIAASLIASVILGYSYIGIKERDQMVALEPPTVCGAEIVQRYNDVSFPITDDGQKVLDDIEKTIDNNKYSINDPTCQAIKFYMAREKNDIAKLESSMKQIRSLHEKSRFVDSDLRSILPLSLMQAIVDEARGA